MDSFRWFRVRRRGQAVRVGELSELLLSSRTQDAWFSFDEGADYRFCRKVQLFVPSLTSDGEEKVRAVDSVAVVRFAVIETGADPILRVCNPGRSLRMLMEGMERAVGQGFSSRALVLGPQGAASILDRADISRLVSVKLKDVVINDDCVGRIELVSKGGVELARVGILDGLGYTVSDVRYEVVVAGVRGAFAVSENGLVKVSGRLAPLIVDDIQRYLIRSVGLV